MSSCEVCGRTSLQVDLYAIAKAGIQIMVCKDHLARYTAAGWQVVAQAK